MQRRCAVALIPIMAVSLLLLSGCDDLEARNKVSELAKQVGEVKAQLSETATKNKQLEDEVKSLKAELSGKMEARITKATDDMASVVKNALDTIAKNTENTIRQAAENTNRLRSDYEADSKSARTTAAAEVQKLRDEISSASGDLKKFMDNQLRELYPYAYQPRRMDPNAPPPPEAK